MLGLTTALDTLDPRFRPIAIELLARLVEERIPIVIVNTRRTPTQQAELRRMGRSWTERSRHQDGLAMDIAPYDVYALHGPDKLKWDENDPVWQRIGKVGETLGLKWGIRMNGRHFDLGHFEFVKVSI